MEMSCVFVLWAIAELYFCKQTKKYQFEEFAIGFNKFSNICYLRICTLSAHRNIFSPKTSLLLIIVGFGKAIEIVVGAGTQ